MPLHEILVWNKSQLARPAGVLFDPPVKSRLEDEQAWKLMMPDMGQQISSGRFIIVLVQARGTRIWNSMDDQYTFKPAEDYVVAAYSVSGDIGNPYTPGTIARVWLNRQLDLQSGTTRGLTSSYTHMFQASSKGCEFSTLTQLKLIKFNLASGAKHAEAVISAQNAMSEGLKYGWRGGAFPGLWVAAEISAPVLSRGRSNAILGIASSSSGLTSFSGLTSSSSSSSSKPDPFADF